MNITIINHEFPPVGGGAATVCELLAKYLSGAGHCLEVVTSRISFLKSVEYRDNYYIKRVLGFRTSLFSGKLYEVIFYLVHGIFYFSLKEKRNKIDVVFAFFTLPAGMLALFIKKMYGIPYFVFLRGIDVPGFYGGRFSFLNKLLRSLIKYIWSNADKVIANSQALKDLASAVLKDKTIFVLPNMIDTGFFFPSEKSHDGKRIKIIFVGRLNKQKRLEYLLSCLAVLFSNGDMPLSMEIIGDGPERNRLIRKSDILHITDKIAFYGWVNRQVLLERYRSADIFISLSSVEGMPNAMMEAMACGLPIIASDIQAHRGLIAHGYNGLLVPLRDPAAVAEAVKTLMCDKSLRRKLGSNSISRIKEYSLQNFPVFLEALGIG